jgi:hypothetical protein
LSTDRSWRKRALVLVRRVAPPVGAAVLAAGLVLSPRAGESAESFLVPGADFSQLELKKGVWCRYVVVDEAFGEEDSTEIYVGIPSAEQTARGPAFWLELATRPLGAQGDEAQVLRLLVLDAVTGFSEGDSLGDYVLRLYIKKGDRPVEEKDPATYEDLSLIVPTDESSWAATEGVSVEVSGGRFACTMKTRTVEDEENIPTGKVRLIRRSRDDFTVWFCDEVPVFRLVKCIVDRSRETETVPRIAGVPVSGERRSRTTAELTGFGFDAESVLTTGSHGR